MDGVQEWCWGFAFFTADEGGEKQGIRPGMRAGLPTALVFCNGLGQPVDREPAHR